MKVTEAIILAGVLLLFGPLMAQQDLPVYQANPVSISNLPSSTPFSNLSPNLSGIAYSEASPANLAGDGNLNTSFLASATQPGPAVRILYDLREKEYSSYAVTSIWIVNGKDADNFENYSRPKTLKLWINGKAHGLIHLEDSGQAQQIQTEELLLLANKSTEFGFEIIDVYPGDESEVAITEILLDGTGE